MIKVSESVGNLLHVMFGRRYEGNYIDLCGSTRIC